MIEEEQLETISNNRIKYYKRKNLDFSAKLKEFYSTIEELSKANNKYIIYGDGSISKLVKSLLGDKILCSIDINDKIDHKSHLEKLKFDKIIISVIGKEIEIIKYLNKACHVKKDKIITIAPHESDFNIIENLPLILVYQPGKVGSSSIYNSLINTKYKQNTFQTHKISNFNYLNKDKSKCNTFFEHLEDGEKLYRLLKEFNGPIKVISGIRDPLSQYISRIFENLERDSNIYLNEDNSIKFQEIKNSVLNHIQNYGWPMVWFDNNFKKILNIDINSLQFNKNQKFFYIKKENIEVVLYKLEYLNSNYNKIFNTLFPKDHIELILSNEAKNKYYYKDYKKVISEFKFSEDMLENYYYNIYKMNNFYTDDELKSFIEKWKF